MSFKVYSISYFDKQLKKLIKRYPSLKLEIQDFIEQLKTDSPLGTPLGSDCYKVRLAIYSKGKGKSGGARVITYVRVSETSVFLLSIYDKSDLDSISDKELQKLLVIVK